MQKEVAPARTRPAEYGAHISLIVFHSSSLRLTEHVAWVYLGMPLVFPFLPSRTAGVAYRRLLLVPCRRSTFFSTTVYIIFWAKMLGRPQGDVVGCSSSCIDYGSLEFLLDD